MKFCIWIFNSITGLGFRPQAFQLIPARHSLFLGVVGDWGSILRTFIRALGGLGMVEGGPKRQFPRLAERDY